MTSIWTIIISIFLTTNVFAQAGSDSVTVDDNTYITHSENFEYSCNVEIEGINFPYLIDLNYSSDDNLQSSRVAVKLSGLLKKHAEDIVKQNVVAMEQIVLSTTSARCLCLDETISIGDSYYGKGVLEQSKLRVFEKKDKSIAVEKTLFNYDEDYNQIVLGKFTGSCIAK